MARSITDALRRLHGLGWLVAVNVAAFVLLRLVSPVVEYMALPLEWSRALLRPWTLLTHMVVHVDWWHLLVNMVWLWWIGNVFIEFYSHRQVVRLYVLGGVVGAIAALVVSTAMPAGGVLLGASAAVAAVMLAITCYRPDYRVRLLIIGDVALKWVVAVIVLIDVLTIGTNVAGHVAHLGGALTGVAFTLLLKRGTDITRWAMPRRRPTPRHDRPTEAELDAVLDKIKRSGYDSLSRRERDVLAHFTQK